MFKQTTKTYDLCDMRFKGEYMWGQDFHEMHARFRGSKSYWLFIKL